MRSRVRPLVKIDSDGAVYRSADGRWTFMRHESDPRPKRWFAYLDDTEFPANSGEGHTTLREVGQWAEKYPIPPRPDRSDDATD
jgi:hypothetical protein